MKYHLETALALLLPAVAGLLLGMNALGWAWLWLALLLAALAVGLFSLRRRQRCMVAALDELCLLLGDGLGIQQPPGRSCSAGRSAGAEDHCCRAHDVWRGI